MAGRARLKTCWNERDKKYGRLGWGGAGWGEARHALVRLVRFREGRSVVLIC